MEVHFTPDLEAKLTIFAARQGRNPDALLQDVVAQYFEEAERSIAVEAIRELPVWHLGDVGSLHRRDIYDDVL